MPARDPRDVFDISGLAAPETVRCRKCKLVFDSVNEYQEHLVRSGLHCACKHCFQEFASPKSLREHIRQYHPVAQDVKCKCGQRFTRAAGLISHLSAGECPGMTGQDLEIRRVQARIQNEAMKSMYLHNGTTVENSTRAASTAPAASVAPSVSPAPARPAATPAPSATTAASVTSGAEDSDDDDDLLYFDHPVKNALPPDHPWSTEANYPPPYIELKKNNAKNGLSSGKSGDLLTSDVKDMGGSLYDAASAVTIPALEPKILQQSTATAPVATSSVATPTAASVVRSGSFQGADAIAQATPDEWSKEKVLEQIAFQKDLALKKDKKNPFHPSCPEFNIKEHWNPVLGVFKCPYSGCGKSKPNRDNFISHLLSPVHSSDEITCVVCLRVYNSPVAYAQHFESQGKKCRARDIGGADVISQATGGVIQIIGNNADHTNKYGASFGENDAPLDIAAQVAAANLQAFINARKRREEAVRRQMERPQW